MAALLPRRSATFGPREHASNCTTQIATSLPVGFGIWWGATLSRPRPRCPWPPARCQRPNFLRVSTCVVSRNPRNCSPRSECSARPPDQPVMVAASAWRSIEKRAEPIVVCHPPSVVAHVRFAEPAVGAPISSLPGCIPRPSAKTACAANHIGTESFWDSLPGWLSRSWRKRARGFSLRGGGAGQVQRRYRNLLARDGDELEGSQRRIQKWNRERRR